MNLAQSLQNGNVNPKPIYFGFMPVESFFARGLYKLTVCIFA